MPEYTTPGTAEQVEPEEEQIEVVDGRNFGVFYVGTALIDHYRTLPLPAFKIYCVLARLEEDGPAQPTMQRLCYLAGLQEPAVKRALRELVARKLLAITPRIAADGSQLANLYDLLQVPTPGTE